MRPPRLLLLLLLLLLGLASHRCSSSTTFDELRSGAAGVQLTPWLAGLVLEISESPVPTVQPAAAPSTTSASLPRSAEATEAIDPRASDGVARADAAIKALRVKLGCAC